MSHKPEVQRISKEKVKEFMGAPDVVIMDLRSDKNWNESDKKILGAVREDPKDVDAWMEKYPKDKTIYAYCA